MRHVGWALAPPVAALILGGHSTTAQAHTAIAGVESFYAYALHPVLVPAHALLLTACSLLLGQQHNKRADRGVAVLIIGFVVGLVLCGIGFIDRVPEPMLLAGGMAIGAAVILARPLPPIFVIAPSGIAGLLVGLDSRPGPEGWWHMLLAYAGLMIGVILVVTTIVGLSLHATKDWQKILVRVLGSWIVAVTLLVLALSLAPVDSRLLVEVIR